MVDRIVKKLRSDRRFPMQCDGNPYDTPASRLAETIGKQPIQFAAGVDVAEVVKAVPKCRRGGY